jgi:chlorobactene glucosyltransferase
MTALLLALPWLLILLFVLFVARVPTELPEADERGTADTTPLVSVVVPARNEALNVETCLRSITASSYPSFEVILVDDRSEDDTAALARALPAGRARRIEVVEGEALPEGWLGKPWACHQGAERARGELLLFTDADTTHHPDLLARAVAGLRDESADLLTVVGRQLMETFWERLVQPQIFLVMLFRFPDFERTAKNRRWREAIANGQFLLFTRAAYDSIGGHAAVRDEVVEDLALAQRVKRAGLALRIRGAEPLMATRMYRSLSELVAGWSKNLVIGGLQSLPRAIRPLVAPVSLLSGIALWVAPPLLLAAALAGALPEPLLAWAATVCALSALTFAVFTRQMGGPWAYGLLYPLGAAVGTYIFLRSWTRGRNVEWKGRRYTLPALSERP